MTKPNLDTTVEQTLNQWQRYALRDTLPIYCDWRVPIIEVCQGRLVQGTSSLLIATPYMPTAVTMNPNQAIGGRPVGHMLTFDQDGFNPPQPLWRTAQAAPAIDNLREPNLKSMMKCLGYRLVKGKPSIKGKVISLPRLNKAWTLQVICQHQWALRGGVSWIGAEMCLAMIGSAGFDLRDVTLSHKVRNELKLVNPQRFSKLMMMAALMALEILGDAGMRVNEYVDDLVPSEVDGPSEINQVEL